MDVITPLSVVEGSGPSLSALIFVFSSGILPMTALLNDASVFSCVAGRKNVLYQQFIQGRDHVERDVSTDICLDHGSSSVSSKVSTLQGSGPFEKHLNQKHVCFHHS